MQEYLHLFYYSIATVHVFHENRILQPTSVDSTRENLAFEAFGQKWRNKHLLTKNNQRQSIDLWFSQISQSAGTH